MVRRINIPAWISWGVFLFVLIAGLCTAIVAGRNSGKKRALSYASRGANSSQGLPTPPSFPDSPSGVKLVSRPLYPYSVIPGGVENAQELQNALAHDPVVADHYKGFDSAKARVVRLDHDRVVYVSYRLGDRVYWTKNRLMLHKGETLITDGTLEARTRCGNRVSDLAIGPVSPLQPSERALEAVPAPEFLADTGMPFELSPSFPGTPILPLGATPASPSTGSTTVIPAPVFPFVGGGSSPRPGITTPPSGPTTPPSGPITPPSGPTTPPSGPITPPSGPTTPPSGPTTPPSGPTTPPSGPTTPLPPPIKPFPPPSVAVPEPGTLPSLLAGFLALGLAGWVVLIRRKRKA